MNATRSGSPAWGFDMGLTTSHCKNRLCSGISHRTSEIDCLRALVNATRSGPAAWGFGVRLTTSYCKNQGVQKGHTGPRNWTDNLERP